MTEMQQWLESETAKQSGIRAEMLEQLAAAYSLRCDIPPDEAELVEVRDGMEVRWFFRRREARKEPER